MKVSSAVCPSFGSRDNLYMWKMGESVVMVGDEVVLVVDVVLVVEVVVSVVELHPVSKRDASKIVMQKNAKQV